MIEKYIIICIININNGVYTIMAEGHRNRLRAIFIEQGINSLSTEEVVELLLTCCIPRKDTADTARVLLRRFGSIKKIMAAPPEQLMEVSGFGEHSATMLYFLAQLMTNYNLDTEVDRYLRTTKEKGFFLIAKYGRTACEYLIAMYFDKNEKLISETIISKGNEKRVNVDIDNIVHEYRRCKAHHFILAHNHPSGVAVPSTEDLLTTKRIMDDLAKEKIELYDHIIFENTDFISFRESGFMDKCLNSI